MNPTFDDGGWIRPPGSPMTPVEKAEYEVRQLAQALKEAEARRDIIRDPWHGLTSGQGRLFHQGGRTFIRAACGTETHQRWIIEVVS